jgi:2-iminoacetate synthase
VQLIAALRLALPDVGIVLSTRESRELRDELVGCGVTRMSAGSRTEPGGYLHPEESLKQFETEDHRTPAEVARMIENKGYEPVWKDWENLL